MKTRTTSVRHLLDGAQRRFARSRPGSVLIMVVALLVLMALIGTAYITMAQSDRYASQQNQYNTQIDLLVQSVVSMVKGTVGQELFVNTRYRPATDATYKHYTGVGPDDAAVLRTPAAASLATYNPRPNAGTWWLAERLPTVDNIFSMPVGNNLPHWRFITGPLNGANFESPVQASNVRFTF